MMLDFLPPDLRQLRLAMHLADFKMHTTLTHSFADVASAAAATKAEIVAYTHSFA